MAGRKRGATSDLNHDNWDQDETPEEKGSMIVASTDTLESRNIIRAKRKLTTTATSSSPFAGLSLFGSQPMSASSLVTSGFSFSATPQPSFQSPVISSFNNSDNSPSFANTGLFSSMLAPSKFSSNNGVKKDEIVVKKDEDINSSLRDNSTNEVTTSNVSAAASGSVDETSNSKDDVSQESKSGQNSSTYREAHNDSFGNVSNDDNDDDFDVEEDDDEEEDEVEKDNSEVAEPYADSDSPRSSSEDISQNQASSSSQAEPTVADAKESVVDNDLPPLPPDDDDW